VSACLRRLCVCVSVCLCAQLAQADMVKYQDQTRDYSDTVKDYENHRSFTLCDCGSNVKCVPKCVCHGHRLQGTTAVFCLPFLLALLVVAAGVTKLSALFVGWVAVRDPRLTNCRSTWMISWSVMALFWLGTAVHLPLSLLMGDGCRFADSQLDKLDDYLSRNSTSRPDPAQIARACIFNTSLLAVRLGFLASFVRFRRHWLVRLQALDVEDQLNFTDKIDFFQLPDIPAVRVSWSPMSIWLAVPSSKLTSSTPCVHFLHCLFSAFANASKRHCGCVRAQIFNFSELRDFRNQVNALTLGTFGFNGTRLQQVFQELVNCLSHWAKVQHRGVECNRSVQRALGPHQHSAHGCQSGLFPLLVCALISADSTWTACHL